MLKSVIEKNDVDKFYLAWNKEPSENRQKVNEVIRGFPLKLRIVPNFVDFEFLNADLANYDMLPVFQFHSGRWDFGTTDFLCSCLISFFF